MPATFKPARVSGSTAKPPAPPKPTTATSTGFRLMAILYAPRRNAVGLGLDIHPLVFRTCRRARAGIADQIPSGEIPVAAIVGISEHAFERQPPGAGEELARVGEALRGAGLDRGYYGIAFFG